MHLLDIKKVKVKPRPVLEGEGGLRMRPRLEEEGGLRMRPGLEGEGGLRMRPWLEGEGGLGLDVVGKGIEWKACMGMRLGE